MPAPILYIAGPITGVEYYAERFDGVALLDGWEDSRGASWKHRIATEVLAIPCLPGAEWLELGGMLP